MNLRWNHAEYKMSREDKLLRRITTGILLFLLGSSLPAEVSFSDLDLAQNDMLLFRATSSSPIYGDYDTLFWADLSPDDFVLKQLTFFPERIMRLEEDGSLQIQNRFGLFRTDPQLKRVEAIESFPSFIADNRVVSGKLNPLQLSPNGRYLLYMKQNSSSFGDLVLFNIQDSQETVISSGIEISLKAPPTIWSPDSQFVIYCKSGALYYLSITQLREKRLISEEYRQIGTGQIGSVRWGRGNSLYYISGSLVFRLDSRELFTRALYSGYLQIGSISGKIPFVFDPNFDSFWISPDGKQLLLNKGGRNVFLYLLTPEDFLSVGETQSLPYLYLPRNTRIKKVLWPTSGTITILTEGIEQGTKRSSVYRLQIPGGALPESPVFSQEQVEQVQDLILSPDEESLALIQEDRVILLDYELWKKSLEHKHSNPLHVLWSSGDDLIIAGAHYTELWDTDSGDSRIIALSQAGDFSFSPDEQNIYLTVQGESYSTVSERNFWESGPVVLREKQVATVRFRVYLEQAFRGQYRNMIMVRDIRQYGTRPLVPERELKFEPYPDSDEPLDFVNFVHGSRIRQREVALVFNAVDSIDGLTQILNTLGDYGLRATFFVNGEVIRRYSDAVLEIAQSGHEVGSLFYTYFDMTDSRFHLDKDFIKRGLARNEDDYYQATARELSLLWHAPYYFVSSEIIAASKEMNYTYVGRDVDSLDWVTEEVSQTTPGIYLPSAKLVERIIEQKRPGSIIPILLGIPKGKRADYLFQKLDLLIDGLLKLGYSIVPVTTLIEHAK